MTGKLLNNKLFINIVTEIYIYLCINIIMNRKRVIIGVTMALIFVFTAFSPAISNNTNIASSVPEIASISNSINKIPVFNIKPAGKDCVQNSVCL